MVSYHISLLLFDHIWFCLQTASTISVHLFCDTLMMTVCRESKISIDIYNLSDQDFTQFALDPSSMNLKYRVAINHPALSNLFKHLRVNLVRLVKCVTMGH